MFSPQLPVDAELGPVAERFRCHPRTVRSDHPVLSFAAAGAHAQEIVAAQSLDDPLGPVEWLYDHHGDVVLIGVDHRANVALHLAEKYSGRKQFVRWAVGRERAYRLTGFPGCSAGFDKVANKLTWVARQTNLGTATLERIPITDLIEVAVQAIQEDPHAFLCDDPKCECCSAVRR